MAERDFLDEVIEERTKKNPEFPELVAAASRRRKLMRAIAEGRQASECSQTAVAARVHTSQSQIARLENGSDARLSTIERFAGAVGFRIQYHLVPLDVDEEAPVIVHGPPAAKTAASAAEHVY